MAFPSFSQTSRSDRLELLENLLAAYRRRIGQIAAAMTTEVGIPKTFSEGVQAKIGERHLQTAFNVLTDYQFEEDWNTTRIIREPIGVCGLISPWNWPMNQIMVKVAPALAAGCTMVLKPSQYSPLSALLMAEAVHEAKIPAGVFNMVNGPGSTLGAYLAVSSAGRHGLDHRLDRGRGGSGQGGGLVDQAGLAGTGRQVGLHRVRRRRPRRRSSPAGCGPACATPGRAATRRPGCWSP